MATPPATTLPLPFDLAAQLLNGYVGTQLLVAASELGVFEHLAGEPRRATELAQSTGAHPGALSRLLRGLTSYGICRQDEGDRVGLTPLGACFAPETPGSLHDIAVFVGRETYPAWGNLLGAVRTGAPAFDTTFGMSTWEHRARDPEAGQAFFAFLAALTAPDAPAILEAYDFSRLRQIADIGGGTGTLLQAILRAHPDSTGVLFDTPTTIDHARLQIAAAGLLDRCQLVGGDFLDEIPAGADAYILSYILHDWDDVACRRILRSCRAAMGPTSRLLVVERVLPERVDGPSPAVFLDLMMLVMERGRERAEGEYRALFAAEGLSLTRVIPTASPTGIGVLEVELPAGTG